MQPSFLRKVVNTHRESMIILIIQSPRLCLMKMVITQLLFQENTTPLLDHLGLCNYLGFCFGIEPHGQLVLHK